MASVISERSQAATGVPAAAMLDRRGRRRGPEGDRISVRGRSLRVAALAAVLTPIGLVMSVANDSPVQAPEPAVQRPGVVWAGRVFFDRETAAAWLRARGVSYASWAERHPVAASQLDAR